jgi:hypothetical protein
VVIALVRVDIASRPGWTRNRRDVRRAHNEISARLHAAYFIWQTRHEVVTNAQFLAMSGLGAELSTAVFGERETIMPQSINIYETDCPPVDARFASSPPSRR